MSFGNNIQTISVVGVGVVSTLSNGLVSYWNLEEASGTRSDSVGTNHLDVGAAAVTNNTGVHNNCAENDNLGHLVKSSTSGIGLRDEWSVSMWVNVLSGFGPIPFWLGSASSTYQVFIQLEPQGADTFVTIYLASDDSNSTCSIGNTVVGVSGQWLHIVGTLTKDGNDCSLALWVNGIRISFSSQGYPSGVSAGLDVPIYMMTVPGGGAGTVLMDEVGIWTRCLTDLEIADIYNAGTGLFYPF